MLATFIPVCIPLDTKSWVNIPYDGSNDGDNDTNTDVNSDDSNDYLE